MNKYKNACYECGKKKYGDIKVKGITFFMGYCEICGKRKGIIPARDWETKNKGIRYD